MPRETKEQRAGRNRHWAHGGRPPRRPVTGASGPLGRNSACSGREGPPCLYWLVRENGFLPDEKGSPSREALCNGAASETKPGGTFTLPLRTDCVPGTVRTSSNCIPRTLAGSRYNYLHSTDEKLSQGKCVAEPECEPGWLMPGPLDTE